MRKLFICLLVMLFIGCNIHYYRIEIKKPNLEVKTFCDRYWFDGQNNDKRINIVSGYGDNTKREVFNIDSNTFIKIEKTSR